MIPGKNKTKTELMDVLVAPKISTAYLLCVKPKVPLGELVVLVCFCYFCQGLFLQLCSAAFVIHLSHENLAQETEIGAAVPLASPAGAEPASRSGINPAVGKPLSGNTHSILHVFEGRTNREREREVTPSPLQSNFHYTAVMSR